MAEKRGENGTVTVVEKIRKVTNQSIVYAKIADHMVSLAQGLSVRSPEDRCRSEGQETLPLSGIQSFDVKANCLIMSPMVSKETAKELRDHLSDGLMSVAKYYENRAADALRNVHSTEKKETEIVRPNGNNESVVFGGDNS